MGNPAEKVRLAFVGAGNHSTQSLYPNFAFIPEIEFAAVCDLDTDKAAQNARNFGASESYTDLTAMLDTVQPDAVAVCGMPAVHYEVGMEVLQRGIPLWVEKPPAPDTEKAGQLLKAAIDNNTFGMVGFMKRFAPANIMARDVIRADDFGGVSSITVTHGAGPYRDPRDMMMFNGIHIIDIARFFGGEIDRVYAEVGRTTAGVQTVISTVHFANGTVGTISTNGAHTWNDSWEQYYITGRHKSVLIDNCIEVKVIDPSRPLSRRNDLKLYANSQSYEVFGNASGWWPSGHYTRGYWGELNHFALSVLGRTAPRATLHDGVVAMQIIDAMFMSAERGAPVSISEV